MKASVKAALFSGLVFPGIGHFVLREYRRGAALFGGALLGLAVLTAEAVKMALAIVQQIETGTLSLDVQTLAELIAKAADAREMTADIAGWVLLLCWIVGIVDSYRIGNLRDRQKSA